MPDDQRPVSDERSQAAETSFVEDPSAAAGKPPVWLRLSGAGLELAFITIVFGAIGAVIDRQVQTARPVFSALVGVLGFTFGMIRFIRLAISVSALQREIESSGSDSRSSGSDEDSSPGGVESQSDRRGSGSVAD